MRTWGATAVPHAERNESRSQLRRRREPKRSSSFDPRGSPQQQSLAAGEERREADHRPGDERADVAALLRPSREARERKTQRKAKQESPAERHACQPAQRQVAVTGADEAG